MKESFFLMIFFGNLAKEINFYTSHWLIHGFNKQIDVAMAVLQMPPLHTDLLIISSFVEISSLRCLSQTVRAREPTLWDNFYPTPCVIWHMSRITCHMWIKVNKKFNQVMAVSDLFNIIFGLTGINPSTSSMSSSLNLIYFSAIKLGPPDCDI